MENSAHTKVPAATTGMLIRRPVADVFEALVNPAITTKFWFTKGSGRLAPGASVQWDWELYGISIPVKVTAFELGKRVAFEWPGQLSPTTIEWTFTARPDGTTFVDIAHRGFTGTPEQILAQAADSAQGFSFVLAGMKALLEFDVRLNLIPDRYPDGIQHP